jgi:superoxide dismutase, Fe-Mn family
MFTLPDLPYDFGALEPWVDETTMRLHHDKHHATYVKNVNDALVDNEELLNMDITALIQSLDKVPEEVRMKVRNNGGGHANHTLFWTMMTPKADKEPKGDLGDKIGNQFGGFQQFKDEFTKSALGVFGSGWAWVITDGEGLKIVSTPNQDTPVMDGRHPILGIDVWEHAYYLKYQNKRPEYVEAWFNVINWDEVARRLSEAPK